MLTQQYNNAMLETRNIGLAKRICISNYISVAIIETNKSYMVDYKNM